MIRLTYRQKLEARSTAAAACMFLAPIPLVVGVVGVILDAPSPVACLVVSFTLAHFAMSWRERVDKAWNEMRCHVSQAGEYKRFCAASECMAWRWDGHDNGFRDENGVFRPTPTGYCGLVEQHHTHPKGTDGEET